jgi:sulfate permease, SulP family
LVPRAIWVVSADSATGAVLAAALAGMAAPGSARYVNLAGLAALLTGGLLLLARAARLGFLINFLSRIVLVGFLAGVGIQVAIAQLPDLLGITVASTRTPSRLGRTVAALDQAQLATVAVSAAVTTSTTRRPQCSPGSPGSFATSTSASSSPALRGRHASNSTGTASAPPWAPAPFNDTPGAALEAYHARTGGAR